MALLATDQISRTQPVVIQTRDDLESMLDILDSDFSFETLVSFISEMLYEKDKNNWNIGDLLVFARHRMNKRTVLRLSAGDDSALSVAAYIKQQYRTGLGDTWAVDLLGWNVVIDNHDQFWILADKESGDTTIWETVQDDPGEVAFEDFVRSISGHLRLRASPKTLLGYYYTSATFPRWNRRLELSWTTHFEVMNLVGSEVPEELKGLARIAQKSALADRRLAEFENSDTATVGHVREKQREANDRKRGYAFAAPLPPALEVIDTEDGNRHYTAIVFEKPVRPEVDQAIRAMLYRAGVTREAAKAEVVMYLDYLFTEDGHKIGVLKNQTKDSVQKAVSVLSSRMKWKIVTDSADLSFVPF